MNAEHTESIQEKFEVFLQNNPSFYPEFCKRVQQIIDRGVKHYSADAICHIVRFHSIVDGRSDEEYKINNNYTSRVARKWQAEHPEHADFFETRVKKTA